MLASEIVSSSITNTHHSVVRFAVISFGVAADGLISDLVSRNLKFLISEFEIPDLGRQQKHSGVQNASLLIITLYVYGPRSVECW